MEWKFYHTIPGFDRSGLGFAAVPGYLLEYPTEVFVELYNGFADRAKSGLNSVARIGHVWFHGSGCGTHYFTFGDKGVLTGMHNSRLLYTDGVNDIDESDANRLIKASWDLISVQENLRGSLESCILSLERAKRRK